MGRIITAIWTCILMVLIAVTGHAPSEDAQREQEVK